MVSTAVRAAAPTATRSSQGRWGHGRAALTAGPGPYSALVAQGSEATPDWLATLRQVSPADLPPWFADHPAPPRPRRSSAFLVLFGPGDDGEPRIVLTERSHDLRSHAAQVVFPGGHVEPGESADEAALRESAEEVGLVPGSVEVVTTLPGVYLTPQSTELVPVIGWWHAPHAIGVVDPAEVRRVVEPTVSSLADPANRFTATAPGGYRGPGFVVDDLLVWGVTAALLDCVLTLTGRALPWDRHLETEVPEYLLAAYGM